MRTTSPWGVGQHGAMKTRVWKQRVHAISKEGRGGGVGVLGLLPSP